MRSPTEPHCPVMSWSIIDAETGPWPAIVSAAAVDIKPEPFFQRGSGGGQDGRTWVSMTLPSRVVLAAPTPTIDRITAAVDRANPVHAANPVFGACRQQNAEVDAPTKYPAWYMSSGLLLYTNTVAE